MEEEAVKEMDDGAPPVLDLSSCQLHDLDSVDIPPSLMELDLTANRLSSLDPRIGRLSNLRVLSFRQNLLDDAAVDVISGWHPLSLLQELVLRDNKLVKIPDVSIFKKLLVFDISFNEISSLQGFRNLSNTLKELYVSKNEVPKIDEINNLCDLQILELGSNRLRVMENMGNLTKLEELWLGRNRIRAVNLCGLKCIKIISLQSNRLTSMKGLEECITLEEVYLSHNGISKMEGLSTLVNLRVLDISSNRITSICSIENLNRIEDLWLNDNQITELDGIAEAVACSRERLTTLYLGNNPCAKCEDYCGRVKRIFPNLEQVDSHVFS